MSDQPNPNTQDKQEPGAVTWETYIERQPAEIKVLYEQNISGLKSALKSERESNKDAAAKAKRLEELEAIEAKRKQEAMSEQEKLTAQIAELQAKANGLEEQRKADLQQFTAQRIKSAVKLAAMQAGFVDPDDAVNLADLSGIKVEDGDKIDGIKEALEALVKAKPYLIGGGKAPGTPAAKPNTRQPVTPPKPQAPTIRF